MAWLSGWQYRRKITIDATKIDENLTDFPVLVKLNTSRFDFSKARSDGYDIRFTSSDGETLLKYERERHDASNQVAEYHVKIPSVSSSQNTEFYIYYGKSDASDGADPTNVWDSNFKAVWHLQDLTSSSVKDSTANSYNGTKYAANEPIETDGKIGKAQSFDGTNDRIDFGDVADFDFGTGPFTLEAFIRLNALNKWQRIFSKRWITGNYEQYTFSVTDTNKLHIWTYGSGWGTESALESNTSLTTNTWYYVVAIRQNGTLKLFINGIEDASATLTARNVSNDGSFWIGGDNRDVAYFFDGIIDEGRVSNIARSSAWIKASYHSGNDSLLSFGAEETAEIIVQLPTQQLALSQQIPTIITQKNATALLDVLGLILEQKGINVIAIKNATISLDALNLVLSQKSPTINIGILVQLAVQQLGLDLKIPTITTTKNPIVELPAQALELGQLIPNVLIPTIVSLPTLNLETNQLLPQIIATKNPIIDLSSLNLSLLLKNPKIKSIAWKFKERPEKDWKFPIRF